jgi:predicted ester cyclase
MWVGFFTTFPDFHLEPGTLRHGDDHVFVEVRATGTQQVELAGIPATGRTMDTRMACLYEFEGDQLVCERVYLDMADVARQLAPVS